MHTDFCPLTAVISAEHIDFSWRCESLTNRVKIVLGDYIWLRIDMQWLHSCTRLNQMCRVMMSSSATVQLIGVLSKTKKLINSGLQG